jgi:hypothetical protein
MHEDRTINSKQIKGNLNKSVHLERLIFEETSEIVSLKFFYWFFYKPKKFDNQEWECFF